ncbi:hypothetical protein CKAH01_18031 [Colletotrichum kahawae]|uniref:Uncharacterized protein n=1 Tax=Colletotrichum kahawae TaxID=34407 RepID=A0AAD9YBD6_COLKA|nr:hypothetical protein CKAH01_18031 [Colletotrichum kahawae]
MPTLWPHHSTDHSTNCVYHVSQTMLFFGSLADCSSAPPPGSAEGKSGNYLFGTGGLHGRDRRRDCPWLGTRAWICGIP